MIKGKDQPYLTGVLLFIYQQYKVQETKDPAESTAGPNTSMKRGIVYQVHKDKAIIESFWFWVSGFRLGSLSGFAGSQVYQLKS